MLTWESLPFALRKILLSGGQTWPPFYSRKDSHRSAFLPSITARN